MIELLNSKSSAIKNINIYPSIGGYSGLKNQHAIWKDEAIRDDTLLYYVVDGEFVLTVEDKNYIVRSHQLALLPRNKKHTYYLSSSKKLTVWLCSFRSEVEGEDFFEYYGLADDNHVVSIEKHEHLVNIFQDLFHSSDYDSELSLRLNSAAKTIDIIAMYVDARIKQMPSEPLEFEMVTNYMHENLGEKINLAQLSEMMHMEPTYFVRKFKKKMGVSPLRYYDDLKIKKSIELIMNTHLPISKIGDFIGIDSPLYFSQFFKKHIGISPTEYKKLFKK